MCLKPQGVDTEHNGLVLKSCSFGHCVDNWPKADGSPVDVEKGLWQWPLGEVFWVWAMVVAVEVEKRSWTKATF